MEKKPLCLQGFVCFPQGQKTSGGIPAPHCKATPAASLWTYLILCGLMNFLHPGQPSGKSCVIHSLLIWWPPVAAYQFDFLRDVLELCSASYSPSFSSLKAAACILSCVLLICWLSRIVAQKLIHKIFTFKLKVLLFWGLFLQSKVHFRHFFLYI